MNEATIPANSEDLPFDELKRSFAEAQDPALRLAMLEAMADRGEEGPMAPILTNALSDPDEGVRETALNLLKSAYDPAPLSPLASMSTLDKNPDFRTEAMMLMTDQLFMEDRTKEDWATVTAALNRGLSDPDANLRELAALLLPELSQSARPNSKRGF
jgi:HEAT repeat protein